MPEDPSQEEPTKMNYRVARVEQYIDTDGQIKKALSYGEETSQLKVWYDLEEVLKTFSKWKMPTPSNFFNSQKFNRNARKDLQENKKNVVNQGNGNQGGRGSWRGRGGRGSWKKNYNSYSSGVGRGSYNSDRRDRDREREQKDWEDYQAQRKRERENQDYHSMEFDYNNKRGNYEDKKRARSPSRGDRPSREDRDYQGYYRRDQSPDRREQAPERRSRWDYSPDRRREDSKRNHSLEDRRRYQEDNK